MYISVSRFILFFPPPSPACLSVTSDKKGGILFHSLFISLLPASQSLPCNPSCFSVSVCVFDCLWLILILDMWPRKLFIKHILSHVSKAVWILFNSSVLHSRQYPNSYNNASFLIVCKIAYCNFWHVSYEIYLLRLACVVLQKYFHVSSLLLCLHLSMCPTSLFYYLVKCPNHTCRKDKNVFYAPENIWK